MKSKLVPIVIASFVAGFMAAPLLWNLDATLPLSSSADAAQVEKPADDAQTEKDAPEYSPVKARARDFYTPNSEDLRPDEMRLRHRNAHGASETSCIVLATRAR